MQLNVVTRDELEGMLQAKFEALAVLLNRNNGTSPKDNLYNNKEACIYLKVCPKSLQNYRNNGLIRFIQIGRKIYYTQTDLNAFLEAYKNKTFIEQIKNKKYDTIH